MSEPVRDVHYPLSRIHLDRRMKGHCGKEERRQTSISATVGATARHCTAAIVLLRCDVSRHAHRESRRCGRLKNIPQDISCEVGAIACAIENKRRGGVRGGGIVYYGCPHKVNIYSAKKSQAIIKEEINQSTDC